jgi:two-component system, OmpR family, phosphate regulon response regulator PhoB
MSGAAMKKILIVDDQVLIRELIEVTLRGDEYRILLAGGGEEALALARRELPQLVIMDVMMPGAVDGYEATRLLKGDPSTAGIKIIILSAKGLDADRAKGIDAGADEYIVKPFSPLQLMRRVEELLGE